jgi:TetR/AcrR family transcriptional regulator, cholesterol catabolism regulator
MIKRKTRTYNPEQTRADIVRAALSLFEQKGYHGTSVGEIAERAGITKGAFYHHFGSKEELLQLIHDEFSAYQEETIRVALDRGDDPREQLRQLVLCMVEGIEKYRPHVTVFFQERRHLSPESLTKIRRKRDQMEGTLVRVFERGVASGAFRPDLDPRTTCLGIIGMCAWTYQWFSPKGRRSGVQIATEFAEVILKGIEA